MFLLDVSSSDVIGDRVAEHMTHRILSSDVPATYNRRDERIGQEDKKRREDTRRREDMRRGGGGERTRGGERT